jgi:hypothetical protein
VLVEPGTFDVEQFESCQTGERQGIDGELRDWFVRLRIGLVIQNMNCTVSDLEKVEVPGDGARPSGFRRKFDCVIS